MSIYSGCRYGCVDVIVGDESANGVMDWVNVWVWVNVCGIYLCGCRFGCVNVLVGE